MRAKIDGNGQDCALLSYDAIVGHNNNIIIISIITLIIVIIVVVRIQQLFQ